MTEATIVRPFVMGLVVTDEWAASPNMGEGQGDGASKMATMKTVRTSEGLKTILSGQAVGSWHRQTLYDKFGWKVSELQETVSDRDTRSFYTRCQPQDYEEDDGRGYMAAVKSDHPTKKGKDGKPIKVQLTTRRTSPFMLSQFQSVAPNRPETDYGVLARNLDELPEEVRGGLIFKAQVAAASYAGLFALNVSELGRFAVGAGRDLLPLADVQDLITSDLQSLHRQTEHSSDKDAKLEALYRVLRRSVNAMRGTVYVLAPETRKKRAQALIAAMGDLQGGGNMTRRLYNVAPATVLVAYVNGGNCLPPHIVRAIVRDEDMTGRKTYKFIVDIDRLHKVICDNADRLLPGCEAKRNGTDETEKTTTPDNGSQQIPESNKDVKPENSTVDCQLFFGTLGSPSIENEEAVVKYLQGEDTQRKLPEGVKACVCKGPREALKMAAEALPDAWFAPKEGELAWDKTIQYGEQLMDVSRKDNK